MGTEHFKINRELEYFSKKEMATLLGGSPKDWLLIMLNELLDNSLDAAEQTTSSPQIDITIDDEGTLTIADNGPGLPAKVVEGALDYSIRISDKNGRVAPSRGQLGNALKCLFAVPLLINGSTHVVIESQGHHHDIRVGFDPGGSPDIQHHVKESFVKTGCFFKIYDFFESRFQKNESGKNELICTNGVIRLIRDFSAVNHHATFQMDIIGSKDTAKRSGNIKRWTADNALVPHWYDVDQFKTLMRMTYQNIGNVTINQFIAGFKGLTGTEKQKNICEAVDINSGDGIEFVLEREHFLPSLLGEMQKATTPIKPAALGYLNEKHVIKHWATSEEIHHRKANGITTNNRPFTLDIFFEKIAGAYLRTVDIALNNSILIDGHINGLDEFFDDYKLDYFDPIQILIHISTPQIEYHSKGKNSVSLDANIMEALRGKLRIVSADWTKHKKAKARSEARAEKAEYDRLRQLQEERPKKVLPSPSDIEGLRRFAEKLKEIQAELDFKSGARGWCYLLEEHIGLPKSEFKTAESRIGLCRKTGLLPWDFTAADKNRMMICGDHEIDINAPDDFTADVFDSLKSKHLAYHPVNLHDFVNHSIVVAVEKIELVELFRPVCESFHVPLFNCKGWSDINSRCSLLIHFKEMHDQGKECRLLYCGDCDPGGLRISDHLKKNLKDLEKAVGFSTGFVIIERFGLNPDFIDQHGLSWIDNLDTGNPDTPSLDNPSHDDHHKDYVQSYIKTIGVRKCEANSLVVRHQAGRQFLTDTIGKYIKPEQIAEYKAALKVEQGKVKEIINQRFAA